MGRRKEKLSQGRLGLEGTLEHFGGELSGTAGASCGVGLWMHKEGQGVVLMSNCPSLWHFEGGCNDNRMVCKYLFASAARSS